MREQQSSWYSLDIVLGIAFDNLHRETGPPCGAVDRKQEFGVVRQL